MAKLENISISNIKTGEDYNLTFHPSLTLFLCKNGSGTLLLNYIRYMLGEPSKYMPLSSQLNMEDSNLKEFNLLMMLQFSCIQENIARIASISHILFYRKQGRKFKVKFYDFMCTNFDNVGKEPRGMGISEDQLNNVFLCKAENTMWPLSADSSFMFANILKGWYYDYVDTINLLTKEIEHHMDCIHHNELKQQVEQLHKVKLNLKKKLNEIFAMKLCISLRQEYNRVIEYNHTIEKYMEFVELKLENLHQLNEQTTEEIKIKKLQSHQLLEELQHQLAWLQIKRAERDDRALQLLQVFHCKPKGTFQMDYDTILVHMKHKKAMEATVIKKLAHIESDDCKKLAVLERKCIELKSHLEMMKKEMQELEHLLHLQGTALHEEEITNSTLFHQGINQTHEVRSDLENKINILKAKIARQQKNIDNENALYEKELISYNFLKMENDKTVADVHKQIPENEIKQLENLCMDIKRIEESNPEGRYSKIRSEIKSLELNLMHVQENCEIYKDLHTHLDSKLGDDQNAFAFLIKLYEYWEFKGIIESDKLKIQFELVVLERTISSTLNKMDKLLTQINEHNSETTEIFKDHLYDIDFKKKCVAELLHLRECFIKHYERILMPINDRLRKLWHLVFKDNHIIQIQIGMDETSSYLRYRLVQDEGGILIPMNEKCNVNQGALACLLVRLAIAENLSKDLCTFVLHEPAVSSCGESIIRLSEVIKQAESNLQFLIFARNTEFLCLFCESGDEEVCVLEGSNGNILMKT